MDQVGFYTECMKVNPSLTHHSSGCQKEKPEVAVAPALWPGAESCLPHIGAEKVICLLSLPHLLEIRLIYSASLDNKNLCMYF